MSYVRHAMKLQNGILKFNIRLTEFQKGATRTSHRSSSTSAGGTEKSSFRNDLISIFGVVIALGFYLDRKIESKSDKSDSRSDNSDRKIGDLEKDIGNLEKNIGTKFEGLRSEIRSDNQVLRSEILNALSNFDNKFGLYGERIKALEVVKAERK